MQPKMKPLPLILTALVLVGCSQEKPNPAPVIEPVPVAVEPEPIPEPVIVTQTVRVAVPYYVAPKPKPAPKVSKLEKLREQKADVDARYNTELHKPVRTPGGAQVKARTLNSLRQQQQSLEIQIRQEKARGGR